jgi:hypothetical protein
MILQIVGAVVVAAAAAAGRGGSKISANISLY